MKEPFGHGIGREDGTGRRRAKRSQLKASPRAPKASDPKDAADEDAEVAETFGGHYEARMEFLAAVSSHWCCLLAVFNGVIFLGSPTSLTFRQILMLGFVDAFLFIGVWVLVDDFGKSSKRARKTQSWITSGNRWSLLACASLALSTWLLLISERGTTLGQEPTLDRSVVRQIDRPVRGPKLLVAQGDLVDKKEEATFESAVHNEPQHTGSKTKEVLLDEPKHPLASQRNPRTTDENEESSWVPKFDLGEYWRSGRGTLFVNAADLKSSGSVVTANGSYQVSLEAGFHARFSVLLGEGTQRSNPCFGFAVEGVFAVLFRDGAPGVLHVKQLNVDRNVPARPGQSTETARHLTHDALPLGDFAAVSIHLAPLAREYGRFNLRVSVDGVSLWDRSITIPPAFLASLKRPQFQSYGTSVTVTDFALTE